MKIIPDQTTGSAWAPDPEHAGHFLHALSPEGDLAIHHAVTENQFRQPLGTPRVLRVEVSPRGVLVEDVTPGDHGTEGDGAGAFFSATGTGDSTRPGLKADLYGRDERQVGSVTFTGDGVRLDPHHAGRLSVTPTAYAVLTSPLSVGQILSLKDHHNTVTGVVAVHLGTLISSGHEEVLDLLSERLTGTDLLQDISYRPVGVDGDTVHVEVTGDVSGVLELQEEEQKSDGFLCAECSHPYGPDPSGSAGVLVHLTDDEQPDYDRDRDHAPVPVDDSIDFTV